MAGGVSPPVSGDYRTPETIAATPDLERTSLHLALVGLRNPSTGITLRFLLGVKCRILLFWLRVLRILAPRLRVSLWFLAPRLWV